MKRKEEGITLVALIVTIIILIILAGISIGALTGDGGIIDNAKYSAFATKIRSYEETVDRYVIDEASKSGSSTDEIDVLDPDKIKEILGDEIEEGDENKYVIQDDELRYRPENVDETEEEWLIKLGILAMTTVFVLTFMANGSVYQTIETDKIVFPEIEPTSSSGNFAGWYYDQETNNQAEEGKEITKNITLYAKFGDFIATFMGDGKVFEKIEGNSLKFPSTEPTKDTVKFVGWYYDEEGKKEAKVGDTLTANTTIYPKWTSYIINKLDGKLITRNYYPGGGSEYKDYDTPNYIENIEYNKLLTEGEDLYYQYKGSNPIKEIKVISSIKADKYNDFGEMQPIVIIESDGRILSKNYSGGQYFNKLTLEFTFEDGTTDTDVICIGSHHLCLAEGTKITLSDMSKKNIEDITYDDELLVWNFDEGHLDKAKPLFIMKAQVAEEYNLIKFDDGTELKTVIDHRIFNIEKQKFTYTMNEEETPIGTSVFKEDGSIAKIVERSVVKEKVNYYNVITEYHMNLFAEGILTSLRLNNLYKIENMKFVKDDRKLVGKEEFEGIPDKYFYGLRLAEQPKEINKKNDVKHTNTLQEYVKRLLPLS